MNKLRLGWDTNFNEGASMQKENRKYYEAYEDRYKTAHEKGVSWEQMKNTPIVMDINSRYHLITEHTILEITCIKDKKKYTN